MKRLPIQQLLRIVFFFGFLGVSCKILHAQNLVSNPGFENNIGCISSVGWTSPTLGTPDYMNACAPSTYGVPANFAGNEYAHSGDAYFGLVIKNSGAGTVEWREYIQAQLINPLVIGDTYEVSMFMSLADDASQFGSDAIGALFSTVPISRNDHLRFTQTVQALNQPGNYITNKNGWTSVTFSFLADSAYTYITIGNFFDDANTPVVPVPGGSWPRSYFYIDDVSVQLSSQINITGVTTICAGDSTTLVASGGAGYQWADSLNPAIIIGNSDTLQILPMQTTTYLLYTSNDTLSVTVNVFNANNFNLGADTTLCPGDSISLNAFQTGLNYLWSDGSTNATLQIVTPGTYSVVVTSVAGCTAVDSVVITPAVCSAPSIALSSSDTSFCEKRCINFFDLSTNNPTSWQWFFPGADSLTSTLQNPTNICYNQYGSFDVTLIACNAAGCDTLVIPGFINEYQTLTPTITQSNDTLFSSTGVSYQWWNVNTGIIAGANNYYYIPTQGGSYYVIVTDTNGCEGVSNTIIITGVNQLSVDNWQLVIVPNPNDGNFTVTLNESLGSNFSLRLIDCIGRSIYTANGWWGHQPWRGGRSVDVNLGHVGTGLYVVELINNGKVYHGRFIVQ